MSLVSIGPVVLTDRDKYRWRQLPQKKNYTKRVRDWRGRNGSRLTYRKLTSITLEFEVVCLGSDMDDCRVQEKAIEDILDTASDWSIGRTDRDFVGTEVLFTEAAGGETPRVWSVQSGTWEEHDQALWTINQIWGHLSIDVVPYFSGVQPYPVRLGFTLPSIQLVLGSVRLTPDPVVLTFAIPTPSVINPVTIRPDPVPLPFVIPAPYINNGAPVVVTPDPVAMPFVAAIPSINPGLPIVMTPSPTPLHFAVPAPVISATGPNITVFPSPVTMPFVVPDPVIDSGAFDMASVSSKFEYWFKADDLAGSNGDGLSSWNDSGTHNRDATTGSTPPVLADGVHGSRRVVFFENHGLGLVHVNMATAQIFIVAKVTDTFFQGTILRTSTTGGDANYGYGIINNFGSLSPYFHVYDTSGAAFDKKQKSTLVTLPYGFNLYRIEGDTTSGITKVNLTQVAETLSSSSASLSGASGINPDNHCKFYLAELVVAQGLTSTELDNVEQALVDKWAL